MKIKFTLIAFLALSFFVIKSFAQVTYPCGVYNIELAGTSSQGGEWSQVYNSPDITLATWFKLTDPSVIGRRMEIFNRYDFTSTEATNISLAINESGEVVFKSEITGASQLFDSVLFGLKPEISKWYHVAVTFNSAGNLCNTYINGVPAASKAFAGPISYVNTGSAFSHYMTYGFRDGGQYGGYSNFYKGYLDEAVYCQKALTASQVETLAKGITPGDAFIANNSMAVYHKFDDYPSQPNYGTYGGTLPTNGQYHYCPAAYNPPVANAGDDQTITLPTNSTTLSGSATPGTGNIVSGVWSKLSGPAGGDISDPNSQTPVITNLQAGTYVFKLTITDDNGITGTDDVSIMVNPAISYSILDPNPSMIMNDGSLSTDFSKINYSQIVAGAATDGVTKVLLVVNSDSTITFSLDNAKDGALFSLDDQKTLRTIDTIKSVNHKVVCVYEVPDGYGNNNPLGGRDVNIAVGYTNDTSVHVDMVLHLITPPVVLVHGMWSKPAVWNESGFVNALKSAHFEQPALADYEAFNSWTFNPNSPASLPGRTAVQDAITLALGNYKNEGFAATQVDVVGHSLGGLITRSLSQQPEFSSISNYFKGYVHKLITLGTPHRGSPFGPELDSSRNHLMIIPSGLGFPIVTTLSVALQLAGQPIGSCHTDFGIESEGIKALKQTLPFYAYSITANYQGSGNIPTQTKSYLALKALCSIGLNHSFDTIFASRCPGNPTLESDLIVPMSSQVGYINSTASFSGITHSHILPTEGDSTETNAVRIQDKVIELLLSDDPTEFSPGFPAPSGFPLDCSTATQKVSYNSNTDNSKEDKHVINSFSKEGNVIDSNSFVHIVSPVRGAIFQQNSGTNIKLQFTTSGSVMPASSLFMVEGIGWFPAYDTTNFSASFTLPQNAQVGNLNVVLITKDSSGVIFGDTSHIVITADGTFDSISVDPKIIHLDSSSRERSIYVHGYFTTSLRAVIDNDITNESTGTVYTSQKGTTFKVTEDGLVSALSVGTDTLLVTYNGVTIKVPVIVDTSFKYATLYPNTINFPAIPNKTVGDSPFGLSASVASGEQVIYTVVSGPATIENGVVILTGEIGTVTVTATSAGDAYFKDANPVTRSFEVIGTLPVTLLSFDAVKQNKSVQLSWKTATEINSDYFIVERSSDRHEFKALQKIFAAGNSNTIKNYVTTDTSPLNGISFYRLRQVDKDGKFTYSEIRRIEIVLPFAIYITPNIVKNNVVNISIRSSKTCSGEILILSEDGKIVSHQYISVTEGSMTKHITLSNLSNGVYYLKVITANDTAQKKFIKAD